MLPAAAVDGAANIAPSASAAAPASPNRVLRMLDAPQHLARGCKLDAAMLPPASIAAPKNNSVNFSKTQPKPVNNVKKRQRNPAGVTAPQRRPGGPAVFARGLLRLDLGHAHQLGEHPDLRGD